MSETTLEPVVVRVRVAGKPEAVFRRFVALGEWWPLATHSVGGEDAEAAWIEGREGGRIVERTGAGEEHVWGTVADWDPPRRLAFTWHPGRPPATAQDIEVSFAAAGPVATDLTLVHSGWERMGEAADELRATYVPGWPRVLGRLRSP